MRRRASASARPLRAALAASVLLIAAGGVAGVFIHGENVRVPAHYHGCIVGVTLALMGLGGLVAIVGGLLFVVLVAQSILCCNRRMV